MTIINSSLNTQLENYYSKNSARNVGQLDKTELSLNNAQVKSSDNESKQKQEIYKNSDGGNELSLVEQYALSPNISAMFNAYIEKQKLTSTMENKKLHTIENLSSNGMDKRMAELFAKNSVEVYKQILESQLDSKIAQEVQQQKELKQKLGITSSQSGSSQYLQISGSLVNLYS